MPLHLVPRSLDYVEAVAMHGSIQRASRALGIAASAIDRQILLLEEACNAPLFERIPRGMRITAAGEAMLVMARRWRADADRLESSLREMRGLEYGTVRLAAMDSLANSILPDLVERLHQEHPRIRLSIGVVTPEDAARSLEDGTTDVTIAFNLPPARDQHRVWSAQLPFGAVVAPDHPLSGRDETTMKDVACYSVAAQSQLLSVRRYLDQTFAWLFTETEPSLVTNSLQLLKSALRNSELVLITSQLDVLPELEAGTLVFVHLKDRKLVPQTITVALDTRRSLSRAARIVSDILVDVTRKRLERIQGSRMTTKSMGSRIE